MFACSARERITKAAVQGIGRSLLEAIYRVADKTNAQDVIVSLPTNPIVCPCNCNKELFDVEPHLHRPLLVLASQCCPMIAILLNMFYSSNLAVLVKATSAFMRRRTALQYEDPTEEVQSMRETIELERHRLAPWLEELAVHQAESAAATNCSTSVQVPTSLALSTEDILRAQKQLRVPKQQVWVLQRCYIAVTALLRAHGL